MRTVPLGEVAEFVRGVTFKPADKTNDGSGVPVMRTKNVQAQLDLSDMIRIPRSVAGNNEKYLRSGDTLVSSANSWNLVGKCCWVPNLPEPMAIGGFVAALRARSDELDPRYLYHWFASRRIQAVVRSFGNQTTNISNLSVPRCLKMKFPLPSLEEQRRIAAILDKADSIRAKRRQVLDHLDALTQSIFHDLFERQQDTPYEQLSDLADIVSGITKGRRTAEATTDVPYLAVANVQAGRLALDAVKHIEATASEIDRYALRYGDLVLTEGGDPDKLGRGTMWRAELPQCIHQNHIFRVRICSGSKVIPEYIEAYLASRAARDYFLRSAKQTTGIASINMRQLKALPIAIPSEDSQRAFRSRVASVARQRALAKKGLNEIDKLFASLQSRAFTGEL